MFEMKAGDTKYIVVSVVNDAGEPVVISGASIKWIIARKRNSSHLVTKTVGSGITITGASEFTVKLNPSDTLSLFGEYYNEAEIIESGTSDVSTLIEDKVTITPAAIANL